MTIVNRFEEIDDGWQPQLPQKENKNMPTTTTSTTTRAAMVAIIKLSDPTFDSASYSDAYLAGRSGSKMPTPGVAKSIDTSEETVAKLDETESLSAVTKAQIEYDRARDRARAAGSLPENATRLDATDTDGLSEVTKAQIKCEADRDRARVAISALPTKSKRLDASDDKGLSEVTKAIIAAHNRDEAQRRSGGYDGGGGSAA